jgi:curli biogenesis system outer membrane secretion channel CsgG
MNNFTKGLLLVLAIAAPVAMTAPSVQAATPLAVPAAKSAKVNKNTHHAKMHKHHHRPSAAKAQK